MRPRSDTFIVVGSLLYLRHIPSRRTWARVLSRTVCCNASQYQNRLKSDYTSRRTLYLSTSWPRRVILLDVKDEHQTNYASAGFKVPAALKSGKRQIIRRQDKTNYLLFLCNSSRYLAPPRRIKQQTRNPS